MHLVTDIKERLEEYRQIRRTIHTNPELGFQEINTANLIAVKLGAMGYKVTRGLGGTGVVGSRSWADGSRAIGLRADMDALPMKEENQFAHRSVVDGVFHGCGHDGHIATLLAAAEHIAGMRNLDGTVHLIFQPAEEGLGGAKAMIDDGLFERFPCDAVFGMHNWPKLPLGRFAVRSGPFLAASDTFEITLKGLGGHAAFPSLANNPIPAAAKLVAAIQSIVPQMALSAEQAVLSITQIHAGSADNVIPEAVSIRGSVRSFSPDIQDDLERAIKHHVQEVARNFGLTETTKYTRRYPVLINSAAETDHAAAVAAEVVGADHVDSNCQLIPGSEDFAFMLRARPGCYILAGGGVGKCEDIPMCHDPKFDFNDDLIVVGASYWVRLVESYLSAPLTP